ncbi:MAG: penicillin-binding transpeptidase domain-containing protein [Minisyncoccota bacterium]
MIGRKKKSLASQHLKQLSREIDPDEIFLDAENLPDFDKDQFEGRIEKPIGKGVVLGVAIVFLFVEIAFFVKVINLQIVQGDALLRKSENNRLDHTPIFAMRGVIYDRNKVPLAWNSFDEVQAANALVPATGAPQPLLEDVGETPFPHREYTKLPGFGHTLGYVSYPKRDSKGYYYQEAFVGKDGLEEIYNDVLSGKNGLQIVETDALGATQPGGIVEDPENGVALTLGIDARVQEKLYITIRDLASDRGYMAGAGAIMDVETGELLALTSFPEYESGVISDGSNKKLIQSYQLDKRAVFLDRAVSGLYTPGSIVKPFMAIAALNEGVITPEKQILSTGSISVQNPYNPALKSVFNDWKAHGWVDVRRALAVSSDVYFYEVGGGYQGQRGIGISNIEKYARMFGFGGETGIDIPGEKIGTIPSPEWKAKVFDGEPWRLGDTYHTVIGQYGFQVTLVQAIRAIASIANGGTLVTPHLVKEPSHNLPVSLIQIPAEHFVVAREGMRDAVHEGTVRGLDVPYVNVAGKTGTAEIDAGKRYINSWVVGFFPYEKPRYAFAVVMERGPHDNTIGGVFVMRQMFDWMHQNTPEYLKSE